jgi:biopolymer transport protein ExbD
VLHPQRVFVFALKVLKVGKHEPSRIVIRSKPKGSAISFRSLRVRGQPPTSVLNSSLRNNGCVIGVYIYMDLNRLRALSAAPTASLFLILVLCVSAVRESVPNGVWMPVVRLRPDRVQFSCDGRFVFIQLLADGKTKINGTEIRSQNLRPRVGAIMESHVERVVYVVPGSGISYARFVEALDELNEAATDMHVAVLSGSLRDDHFQRGLEPCDIVWPN